LIEATDESFRFYRKKFRMMEIMRPPRPLACRTMAFPGEDPRRVGAGGCPADINMRTHLAMKTKKIVSCPIPPGYSMDDDSTLLIGARFRGLGRFVAEQAACAAAGMPTKKAAKRRGRKRSAA
jgi:hypothetical protein